MQQDANDKRWFRKIGSPTAPQVRLFCFPYGGSGPWVFRPWQDYFGDKAELTGILYPGRESRINEPLQTKIQTIAEMLLPAILPRLDMPFVFFGHSMGALVSFELTRLLDAGGGPMPQRLIVSGAGAPHIPEPHPIHHLPDQEFMDAVINLNGMPEEVLSSRELLEYALPIIRADFTACGDYRCADQGGRVTCPMVVYGGSLDPRVAVSQVEEWQQHADSEYSVEWFEGDHFFIDSHQDQVLASVAGHLREVLATV